MTFRLLTALLCLLALCALGGARADEDSSIKLPPEFKAPEDDVDVRSKITIVPTNPDLVRGPDYQPLGMNLQSDILNPDLLTSAASFGFSCYRLVIKQADFPDAQTPNLVILGDILSRLQDEGAEAMLTLETDSFDPDSFMEFFKLVDGAVGSQVAYYQFLDNINYHLGVSAYTYHELLARIRDYRESSGNKFTIVCGGIQGVDYKFISELQSAFVFDRVDVIAFNLFPDPQHMELPLEYNETAPHSLYEATAMMGTLGKYGKPFFITALGASSAYAPLGVSQLDQASIIARSILFLLRGGASRIFLHSMSDTDVNNMYPQHCMGLFMLDGTEKPAAGVVRRLALMLKGAYFIDPYYLFQMHNNFPAAADPVFAHHLYNPVTRATSYIYWTSAMNMYDRTTSLAIFRPGLQPFALMSLLTGDSVAPPFNRGGNLLIFAGLPLSHVPYVIQMIGEAPSG
jgi:hypothetical protein